MTVSTIKQNVTESLESRLRTLCQLWGPGYSLAHDHGAETFIIRTPDQGLISVQPHGQDLQFEASGWPQVQDAGFKRSYAQELSARVSAHRPLSATARDLERRLLQPYADALGQARRKAADYRRLITDVSRCLDRAGFTGSDRHVVGRSLQAHKPHGALDDNGKRLPTTSVTTIHAHDDGAVANLEIRCLSLPELESLHAFVDQLIVQRRPVLRLSA